MHEEAHWPLISLVILVRFHFLAEDGLDDLLTKNLWVQGFPYAQIFHIRYMLGWAIWNFCYSATLTYKDGDFLWFSLAKTCSHFLGRTTMARPQLQRDRGSPNLSQIPLSQDTVGQSQGTVCFHEGHWLGQGWGHVERFKNILKIIEDEVSFLFPSNSFYCSKLHRMWNLPSYPFLSAQFRGIKHIQIAVHPSPPSVSRTLLSYNTESLYTLNNSSS